LWPTAVRIVVFQEVGLVVEAVFNFSFPLPVFFSVSIALLFEVRLEAEMKSWWRQRGHTRKWESLGQERTHGIWQWECGRGRILFDFSRLDLLRSEVRWLTGV
jgi:hypothetical protein